MIEFAQKSDRWAPRHWHNAVPAVRRLLDPGKTRERIVEALHQHPVGYQHVVDLAAGRHRLRWVLIKEATPVRMACKQIGMVGDVGLDVELGRARSENIGGVAERMAGGRKRRQ